MLKRRIDTYGGRAMGRRFWREQRVASMIAVVAGILFWLGYGFTSGAKFALVIMLILQIPIIVDHFNKS